MEEKDKDVGNHSSAEGKSEAPVTPENTQDSENGLAGTAISEARATLAAIAAQMAERSGQPMQVRQINPLAYSSRPSTTAPAEEPHAGTDRQTQTVASQSSGVSPQPVATTGERSDPSTQVTQPLRPQEARKIPGSKPAAGLRARFWPMAGLVGALITGVLGIYIGSQLRSERVVTTSLLPPTQTNQGRDGRPLPAQPGENIIADIVAEVSPSVVDIQQEFKLSMDKDGVMFAPQRSLDGAPRRSIGTGIIVRSDGYIITNSHVVRELKDPLIVVLSNKRSYPGRVVGKDGFTDLALLKIDADKLPVARFARSASVRPGDWAIAIGSPLGFDHSVSLGIVSAINRSILDLNNHVDLIQSDVAMNPGNSGGPLLNIKGEVVGINTIIRHDAQNLGFAVPVDAVREVANSLMARGSMNRPYLGIYMQDITPYVQRVIDLNVSHGVYVSRVLGKSPCEKAGIGQGDVILQVDGRPVQSVQNVRALVREHQPGDVVDFIMVTKRGDQERRKVQIGEYPED